MGQTKTNESQYLNAVIYNILITPKGNIHNRPIITIKGLPISENQVFFNELENLIEKTIRTFSLIKENQKENIIDALKIVCRKYSKEKIGKKPITNINLVNI